MVPRQALIYLIEPHCPKASKKNWLSSLLAGLDRTSVDGEQEATLAMVLEAAHAQDTTRAQHPMGRLSAIPAELLNGQDRHKLLAAWLRREG